MNTRRILNLLLISASAALCMSGCNLYGGIDSPSGDAQLISAARAAFDEGNYDQALNYYKQLSSSSSDIATSEQAEETLAQAGATIQNFASAFGNGKNINMGVALSNFAVAMKPYRGDANRAAIFNAFNSYQNIHDTDLKNLVQFLGSLAMAGIVLAEDIPAAETTYSKVDVCPPTGTPNGFQLCTGSGILQAGPAISSTGNAMTGAQVSDFNASTATLSMFHAAILDLLSSTQAIGTTGSFGNEAATLSTALQSAGTPTTIVGGVQAYRSVMVQNQIGL